MKKFLLFTALFFIVTNLFSQTFTEALTLSGIKDGKSMFGDYDQDGDLDILISGRDGSENPFTRLIYQSGYMKFYERSPNLLNLRNSSAEWGDYDNDGDLDILLTGEYLYEGGSYGRSRIYRNDGTLTFTDIDAGLTGVWDGSGSWGDYDNDGDLDVLLSGYNEEQGQISKIYRNNGDGSFTDLFATLTGVSYSDADWGDYDNDGDLDVLLCGQSGSSPLTEIYRNEGNDTFSNLALNISPVYYSAVDWCDYDNDGLLDFAITGYDGSVAISRIYRNNGNETFSDIGAGLAGVFASDVGWSDLDNDGLQDLVLLGDNGTMALTRVYHNNGNGTFSVVPAGLANTHRGSISFGDINNDGRTDILISGMEGADVNTWIYINELFTEVNSGLPSLNGSTAWGDYDGDGDLDLLVSGNTGSVVITDIYRNDGGDSFFAINAGFPTSSAKVSWADYDNDGDLDVLLYGNKYTRLYRNDGSDQFTYITTGIIGLYGDADWGDYDNDGDLDIIVSGSTSNSTVDAVTYIYKNQGSDIFEAQTDISLAVGKSSMIEWGDYDGDGDLDILMSGESTAGWFGIIYRNDRDNVFTDINAEIIPMRDCVTSWGDYDNDGDLDVMYGGYYYNGIAPNTSIYRNDGKDKFTNVEIKLTGRIYGSVQWADFDSDGDLDVILNGTYDSNARAYITVLFLNDGNEQFTDTHTALLVGTRGSSSFGDYDKDGDLDLFTTSYSGSYPNYIYTGKLYKNQSNVFNQKPTTPANLLSQPLGISCKLSWDRAFDNETPRDGLSYNLRIGRSPDDVLVKSPMSDPQTGFRKVEVLNNLLQSNTWIIENLDAGTYYWSVQSVDPGFTGSPFAALDSFTIDFNISIAPTTEQNIFLDTSGSAIVVTESVPADSRQWKFSRTSDGPYDHSIAGATGLSYTPQGADFGSSGEYYVVCFAQRGEQLVISNEVHIIVPQFEESGIPFEGFSDCHASVGDYDNDGDLDILLTGNTAAGRDLKLYRNDGSDVFTEIMTGMLENSNGAASWGDFDKDGDLDLVVTGYSNSGAISRIYRYDGADVFTDIQAGLEQLSSSFADWGDIDNDGDLDLIMWGSDTESNEFTYIYRNEGQERFQAIPHEVVGVRVGWLDLGDYDKDGDLDILMTGYDGSDFISRIYSNDGTGKFTDIHAGLLNCRDLCRWVDYDGDGDLDAFVSGYSDEGNVSRLYRNEGGDSFTDSEIELGKYGSESADWGDIDNDGDMDLMISGRYYSGAWFYFSKEYINEGNEVFVEIDNGIEPLIGSVKVLGDYDNDGDLDMLQAGGNLASERTASIYYNRGNGNIAPTVPQNLSAQLINGLVNLQWDQSSDPETPAQNVSYNLYVSSEPMGSMTLSPMSNRTSGYRHLPAHGNAGFRTSLVLDADAFQPGTNYWSVQAIDHIYTGSAFAAEASIQDVPPSSDFYLPDTIIFRDTISIFYTGNASAGASYDWNFESADYISGSGQGPYLVHWAQQGSFTVSLTVTELGLVSETTDKSIWVSGQKISEIETGLPAIYAGALQWGDYDNDHDMDLLMVGYISGSWSEKSAIYRNDGNNVFTDIDAGMQGVYFGEAVWGDYDNDGDLDVLITGDDGSSAASRIYRNDGNDVFTDINAGLIGMSYSAAAWGDYDNDGDLDALIAGQEVENWENVTKLYRNVGNDVFEESGIPLPGVWYGSVNWGDYDNDGYLDLLLSGEDPGWDWITNIYRNSGDGNFTKMTDIELPGVYEGGSTWGDYDSDGDLDILITGYSYDGHMSTLFRNDGNNVFTELTELVLIGVTDAHGSFGDIDNDGDLDILITGEDEDRNEVAKLYRNDGNDIFSEINIGLKGVSYSWASWGDYDYDNDLDLIMTGIGESGYSSTLYRNDVVTLNSKPSPPDGLTAEVIAEKVILQWNQSSDAETPTEGLSYNVFLWSETRGLAAAPMADSVLGYRLLPGYGNAQLNTSFMIDPSGLGVGENYWTVQAIDNSFTPSDLPEKEIFYINPTSSFSVSRDIITVNDTITVTYSGNASPLATFNWDFDGASYVSGSGQGPYSINWDLPGIYHISLHAEEGSYQSDTTFLEMDVISQTFDTIPTNLPDSESTIMAWGDYDNDGDLDLMLVGSGGSYIYRNDGNGAFTDINAGLPGVSTGSANWGDYDNDGDLDLMMVGSGGSYIYRNDGNDVFTDVETSISGGRNGTASWGDQDNDGDLDILISGYNTALKFYDNEGDGTFSLYIIEDYEFRNGSSSWGDYDNDGDLDILVIGGSDETSSVYRNEGNHEFALQSTIELTGVRYGSAEWGDYDNDGDLDIFINGSDDNWLVRSTIYRNDGNNMFPEACEFHLGAYNPGAAEWSDFDNDGDLDLFITFEDSDDNFYSRIYRNEGGLVFTDIQADLMGLSEPTAAWGDYDNDGDQDLLVSGGYIESHTWKEITLLYRNASNVSNSPPATPTGLEHELIDNTVVFSWQRATDLETPQGSLSYNFYLSPQDTIFSYGPMADTVTGYRHIPARGNQQFGTTHSIDFNQLKAGTNTWSVQAIDHAYAGSNFAEKLSFVLPPTTDFEMEEMIDICDTATVVYTGNATLAATYTWDFDGADIISGSGSGPIQIQWSVPGTHLISLHINANGELSDTAYHIIEVNELCFSEMETDTIALNKGSVKWGDYDNDGDLDAALCGHDGTNNVLRILRNQGDTLFADANSTLLGASNTSVDWGDYDNDGDLDFMVAKNSTVYRNDGSETFTSFKLGLENLSHANSDWGDYDNDGDLDVIVSGLLVSGDVITRLFRNEGNDNFTTLDPGITGINSGVAAWGDYDNDGDLDLVICGRSSEVSITKIYKNNGNNVFADIEATLTGLSYSSVAWGDIDSDGDLDLLITGESDAENMHSLLYINEGNDNFIELPSGLESIGHGSAAFGDMDNNGDLDIVIAGLNNTSQSIFRIYLNMGALNFLPATSRIPGITYSSFDLGDFDLDHDLDIIISGDNGAERITRIYRNGIESPNIPPTVPDGLTAEVEEGFLKFRWNPSSDTETSQSSISYNVYARSKMSGNFVLSPMAKTASGIRMISGMGNAQLDTSSVIDVTNWPTGSYYWSVQSVDNSFAGSAFADADTVLNIPPTAEFEFEHITQCNTSIISYTGNASGSADYSWNFAGADSITGSGQGPYEVSWSSWGTHSISLQVMENGQSSYMNEQFIHVSEKCFTDISAGLSGIKEGSTAWGDYDSDGDLDVIVTGKYGSTPNSRIYRNDGLNIFSDVHAALPGVDLSSTEWGDYDNDGDLDLALTGLSSTGPVSRIYRNDGKSIFNDIEANMEDVESGAANWGDFDNDGDLDLLLTGSVSEHGFTAIYRNDGSDTFVDTDAELVGLMNSTAAWKDYDTDGDLDFAVSGTNDAGDHVVLVYRNDGKDKSGKFVFTILDAGLAGSFDGSIEWGDVDNDGDPDLLIAGSYVDITLRSGTYIYYNEGNDQFRLSEAEIEGVSRASWGDFDNDSWLDIILSGKNSENEFVTKVYRNQGNGSFIDLKTSIQDIAGTASWGDFDHDNDLDIIVSGNYSTYGKTIIYRNDGASFNNLPEAPAGLTARGTAERIVLSWDRSSDPENSQESLTYNLRVGTSPGGNEVVSAMSDEDNGMRRIVSFGNVGHDTSLVLYNIPASTIYWSVQAVDNSFGGSAFAEEQVFLSNPMFSAIGTILPEVRNGDADWGDFDNDGDLDVLITGFFEGPGTAISNLYRNDIDSLVFLSSSLESVKNSSTAWGDYDRDGDLDIILCGLTNEDQAISRIYRNNGGESFTDIQVGLEGIRNGTSAWGDFDNDGDLDLLLSGLNQLGNNVLRIYRNSGNDEFTALNTSLGIRSGVVDWGDYDNDGDLDILFAGSEDNSKKITVIYRNDNNDHFTELADLSIVGVSNSMADWGDYDNDGDLDLLLSGDGSIKLARIYRNDGGDMFTDIQAGLTGFGRGTAAWGDYDCDGDLDILLTGDNPSSIYRNDGNDEFTRIDQDLLNGCASAWGDYDNDGDLDLLLAGKGLASAEIYRNNGIWPNDPPEAPVNLSAELSGYGILLSWDEANDEQSRYGGLSYNLRLGTTKSETDMISPTADLVSGYRLLPDFGNMQLNRAFRIDSMAAGTYYWSVQAIDQTYLGGEWAPLDSFEISVIRTDFSANTVCFGNPTLFSDESLAGGITLTSWEWDLGDGQTSSDQNPVHQYAAAGSYIVTLTARSGVFDHSKTHTIVVKEVPGVDFKADPVCIGTATTIINNSSNEELDISSWNWDLGDGNYSASFEPEDHNYSSGSYNVKLVATAENECTSSIEKQVLVADYPSATISAAGNPSFCEGESLRLSVDENTSFSYQWYADGLAITDATTHEFYPEYTGEYTVSITNEIAGCTNTSAEPAVITVTEPPDKPVIESENYNPEDCQSDDPVILSVYYQNGLNYQWKRNGSMISQENSNTLSGFLDEADFSVEIEQNGCFVESDPLTINYGDMLPKPEIHASGPVIWYLACSNDTAVDFRWYLDDQLIEGADDFLYVAGQQLGKYRVSISNGACYTLSDPIWIPLGTGIDMYPFKDMAIYPNPSKGIFILELDNEARGALFIEIINTNGSVVGNYELFKEQMHFEAEIDMSGNPPASYFIRLTMGDSRLIKTLIVE